MYTPDLSLLRDLSGPAALPKAWDLLSPLPGGKRIFSRLVGQFAPYSGSIGAQVESLGPGFARIELADRRRVRNHLDCVHAMALANLGELVTGLAMLYDFPADARGILAGFEVRYHKKARGPLAAECHTEVVRDNKKGERTVQGKIFDDTGDLCCEVSARWLVGPAR